MPTEGHSNKNWPRIFKNVNVIKDNNNKKKLFQMKEV